MRQQPPSSLAKFLDLDPETFLSRSYLTSADNAAVQPPKNPIGISTPCGEIRRSDIGSIVKWLTKRTNFLKANYLICDLGDGAVS